MTLFYIVVVVGAIVAVTYLTLAARSFAAVRQRVLAGAEEDLGDVRTFEAQQQGFTWKAGAGVAVSVGLLSALALGPAAFYVIPLFAVGSSVAVIVAFGTDSAERGGG